MRLYLKGAVAFCFLAVSLPGMVVGVLWSALASGFAVGCEFVDRFAIMKGGE